MRRLLEAKDITVGYGTTDVLSQVDAAVEEGEFVAIIGPNASGKSTLLRALSRLVTPRSGVVELDGAPISSYAPKHVARRLALLPQIVETPQGIGVADLVARGRFPHQKLLRQWSADDEAAVEEALAATGVGDLRDRAVDDLSGGQRQRVLISMVLAQQAPILLLDEPTTFLDLAHQFEVLELCRRLHRDRGVTIAVVLHDLNQAARYATRLIVVNEGKVVATGTPEEIVTVEFIRDVFGLDCVVIADPVTASPLIIPTVGAS